MQYVGKPLPCASCPLILPVWWTGMKQHCEDTKIKRIIKGHIFKTINKAFNMQCNLCKILTLKNDTFIQQ